MRAIRKRQSTGARTHRSTAHASTAHASHRQHRTRQTVTSKSPRPRPVGRPRARHWRGEPRRRADPGTARAVSPGAEPTSQGGGSWVASHLDRRVTTRASRRGGVRASAARISAPTPRFCWARLIECIHCVPCVLQECGPGVLLKAIKVLQLGVHVLVLQLKHNILERCRDTAAQQLLVPVAHLLNLKDVALQVVNLPKRPVVKPGAFL